MTMYDYRDDPRTDPRDPRARRFGFRFGRHHRWADQDPAEWLFGRFGRRWGGGWRHGPGPGERLFGRGDLKVVILELLSEQPRHGYDIIRALEDRMRGYYRPSPGSVYPTLQMLEDLGYVTSNQQDGKKVYSITDAGRTYLAEQQPTIDDIRSRIAAGWDAASRPEVADLMHELRQLARALFAHATGGALGDPERLKRLRAILQRARQEVEELEHQPAAASAAPASGEPGPDGSDEPRMV
jgi:DNA-binding PadR family transcriptional regulator